MPRISRKPAELRDSWQPAPASERRTGLGRRLRRLAALALALGLVAAWWYVLFQPFRHPNALRTTLVAADYEESPRLVPRYARYAAAVLRGDTPGAAPPPTAADLVELTAPDEFARLAERLRSDSVRPSDVVIVYLAATGAVFDGQPYLLCDNFAVANPDLGRYPFDRLLAALRQSPAGVKLLLLDAGGREHDPRIGIVADTFTRAALEAVERTGDAGLWVLSASAPLERSYVAYGRKQTAFGWFVSRALAGHADTGGDRELDLGELYRYVRTHVASWVAHDTAGFGRQTPTLVCGAGAPTNGQASAYPVLVSVARPTPPAVVAEAEPSATGSSAAPAAPSPSATPSGTASPVAAAPASTTAPSPAPSATAAPQPAAVGEPSPVRKSLADAVAAASAASTDDASAEVAGPRPEMGLAQLLELNRRLLAGCERRTAECPIPNDYAPHLWPAVRRRAESLEYRLAEGTLDSARAEPMARRLAAALAEFAAGRASGSGEVLGRIAAQHAPPSLNPADLGSWGLVERYAADAGPAPNADLVALMATLDGAFAAADRGPLQAAAERTWPDASFRYEEFRLARRLASATGVPWTTLQGAWRCVREGHRAAAHPATFPAAVERIVEADRRFRLGLRTLLDRIGDDWTSRADAELYFALVGYRDAASQCDEYRELRRLAHDILQRSEAYAAWHLAGGGDPDFAPSFDDLSALLDELSSLVPTLDDVARIDPLRTVEHREKLMRLVARVERPLRPASIERLAAVDEPLPARRRRIALLVESGLLTDEARERLEQAARDLDARVDVEPPLVASEESAAGRDLTSRRHALRQLIVDQRRARLAVPSLPAGLSPGDAEALVRDPDPDRVRRVLDQAGEQIRAAYASLPASLDEVSRTAASLEDGTTRSTKLAALRRADSTLRLLDVRDAPQLAEAPAPQRLREAAWHDALTFHRRRFLAAAEDAPDDEAAECRAAAEALARAARTLPRQPALEDVPAPRQHLAGPTTVSADEESLRDVAVTLEAASGAAEPVWLSAEFDSGLLDVRLPEGTNVYRDDDLRGDLQRRRTEAAVQYDRLQADAQADPAKVAAARRAADDARRAAWYPATPAAAEVPPSLELNSGERRTLNFRIRRKSAAAGRTKLIVKAVTETTHVRHEVEVLLPSLESIGFGLAAGSGAWSRTVDGIVLHPWPNRTTQYEFQLTNRGGADRVVDVEFIAPERRIADSLPVGLRTAATSEVLAQVGPAQSLVKIDDLKLPADGRPVTLAAPQPKEPMTAPPPAEERNRAETTVGKTAAAGEKPETSIRHGMLLVVRRRDTGETLLRRIDFRPERPRRYVRPKVGYDVASERIVVDVVPRDRAAVPPEGIDVTCEFPEPLARGTEAQLQGRIQPPDYQARLYVEAPASESRVQTLYLTIDGYPRAFVYRVPCGPPAVDLPEAADVLEARITAPAEGTMLKAPLDSIPVQLQIDAPVGAFDNDRDVVEVGIDRDRDRDFAAEPTLRLRSDRQADVFLKDFGRNGIVTLRTEVRDFRVAVPAGGLQNARVNLAARVQTASQTAWSRPVELGLDGAAPQLSRIELRPDRIVPIGAALEVEAYSVDAEMSGTAQVEIGFDLGAVGKFSEAAPPVKADGKTAPRWTAKLPTAPLAPGPVTLLLRATDRVGNVGEYVKVRLTAISPGEAAAMAAAGARVTGTVRYGDAPLPKVRITLVRADLKEQAAAESDEKGFFALEGVPAGAYRLTARGLARNRPRTFEQPLVVPAPPQKLPRLDVEVR